MAAKKNKEISSKVRVTIHNKISTAFRSVHADGAYGGITPRGLINLNFYSERFPIPKSSVFEFDEVGGTPTKLEDSPDSKDGIIRDYEIGIYLKIETAKSLMQLLGTKIAEHEKLNENSNGSNNKKGKL